MEEKNELNDIILNKTGSGSNSKKLLLAIATLTLVLIVVLVLMNSLKSGESEPSPVATAPEPTAPTEIIDDPLFEPVEVIDEGSNTTAPTEDLGQIAQKIKQESFNNAPVQENVIEPAEAVQPAAPARQSAPAVQAKTTAPAPAAAPKAEPRPAPKTVNTPTIKTVKPAEAKAVVPVVSKPAATAPKAAAPAQKPAAKTPAAAPAQKTTVSAPKAAETGGTYYIQVGSFTKEPNKALFDRLNASGLKYTTVPGGSATKVLVGPFQGEKSARDVLGTVRKNIESGAYIVKG